MMSEAIFSSGFEACRFAYAFSCQQYPMSVMAKIMQCVGIGSGRGLVGLDGAAVAGTVKRHVEAAPMPVPLIVACRHEQDHRKAREYAAMLVPFVLPALGTGGHHRHMVIALICRYFKIRDGENNLVQMSKLCDQFALSADTMTRRWAAVSRRLRELECNAQGRIDDDFRDAGLV